MLAMHTLTHWPMLAIAFDLIGTMFLLGRIKPERCAVLLLVKTDWLKTQTTGLRSTVEQDGDIHAKKGALYSLLV